MQRLSLPGAYSWSQWQSEYKIAANSYFFEIEGGNAVVDPLEPDEFTHAEIVRLGGIKTIALTNADHERGAEALARRYASAIVSRPDDSEEIFPGGFAMHLKDQQPNGEFAINLPALRTVVVGDALVGTPAGALSLLPDDCYRDVKAAALGLRRILSENPQTLLVGHGAPVFAGAYEAIYSLLYKRAGAAVHRINLDELPFQTDISQSTPAVYHCREAEVGFWIGAQKLGYRVAVLAPGSRYCPLHDHALEEELFFVLDGRPSIRTLAGTIVCRRGDFIAFPVGETGTHQLLNQGDAPAMVMLLGRTEPVEANYYPDSDKLLVDSDRPLVRGSKSVIVQASPTLDYFQGE